jgi:hypothetical protein
MIVIRKLLSVSLSGDDVGKAPARCSPFQIIDHLFLHIEGIENSVGEERSRDRQGVHTDSRADL